MVLVRASTPWVMYCIVRPIFKRVGRATSAYENSLWLWGLAGKAGCRVIGSSE
jgi:hypothetical protein